MTTKAEVVPKAQSTAIAPVAKPEFDAQDVMQLGQAFAKSGFFSDATDAAKAIVKICAGRELGLGAMASMTGIIMVKGRPTLTANTMLAVVLNSKRYKHELVKLDNKGCSLRFKRRGDDGWEEVGVSTFTEDDAKLAGLLTGDNYRKYPRNMYFARATSNGCRWFAPDAFCGITPYTPDEIEPAALITEEGNYILPAEVVRRDSPAEVTDRRLVEVLNLLARTGTPASKLCAHLGAPSLSAMSDDQVNQAVRLLRAKAAAPAEA